MGDSNNNLNNFLILVQCGNMLCPPWNDTSISFERDGYSDSIIMTAGHTSFGG